MIRCSNIIVHPEVLRISLLNDFSNCVHDIPDFFHALQLILVVSLCPEPKILVGIDLKAEQTSPHFN